MQDVQQDSELCRCLKAIEELSESKCSRTRVEICRLVSPTHNTKIYKPHGCEAPRDSIFHIKKIHDFESSNYKSYINRLT